MSDRCGHRNIVSLLGALISVPYTTGKITDVIVRHVSHLTGAVKSNGSFIANGSFIFNIHFIFNRSLVCSRADGFPD